MATFINLQGLYEEEETTANDPLVQSATFLKELLTSNNSADAAAAFENKFTEQYQGEKWFELFCHLADQQDAIYAYVEKSTDKAMKDKRDLEADGYFTVMLSIVHRMEDEDDIKKVIKEALKRFTASANNSETKIRVLMLMYNMLSISFDMRFVIFEEILKFAGDSGKFDLMFPYLEHLEHWIEDWDLKADAQRRLYITLSNKMRDLGKDKEAGVYLKKHVSLFAKESASVLNNAATQKATAQLCRDAVVTPATLQVDDILCLEAVKALSKSSGDGQKLVQLLEIFRSGTIDDFKKFEKANASVFKTYDIDASAAFDKVRLLSLATIAEGKKELTLAEVAKGLQVPETDVETWVVKAIGHGVIEGRLDQVRNVVVVKSTLLRQFGKEQWGVMEERLDSWMSNIDSLIDMVNKTKVGGA